MGVEQMLGVLNSLDCSNGVTNANASVKKQHETHDKNDDFSQLLDKALNQYGAYGASHDNGPIPTAALSALGQNLHFQANDNNDNGNDNDIYSDKDCADLSQRRSQFANSKTSSGSVSSGSDICSSSGSSSSSSAGGSHWESSTRSL